MLGLGLTAFLLLWGAAAAGWTSGGFPDVAGIVARVRPTSVLVVNLSRAIPDQATPAADAPRRPRLVPQGFGK